DANGDANGSGGALTMADGARIDAGLGAVRLRADENITLSSVSTANGTTAAISLTSTSAGVVDGGDSDVDLIANTPGAQVTIDAQSGVGAGGALGAIETTVAGLKVTNAVSGDIAILETDSLILAGAVQDGSGDVRVSTAAGGLTVVGSGPGPVVGTNGGGNIALAAGGAASDLVIKGGVTAGAGTVLLKADRDVQFGGGSEVTTTGGSVMVTADDDADGTGGIVMDDQTLIDSAAGTIFLSAAGDITLGGLRSTSSADDAVTIASSAGSILDGGDTFVDVVAADGRLIMQAAAGVGAAGAIETEVDRIDVVNTASGPIHITEADALLVQRIEQPGSGDISLTTLNGTLLLDAGGMGIVAQQGTVSLTAGGASSDVVLEQVVSTFGGKITIAAGHRVTSTVNGTLQTTAASGIDSGSVTIQTGGTGAVKLAGTVDTSGATGGAASAGGDVTITTVDGSVTLACIDVSGGGAGGSSGQIVITSGDASGQHDSDVVLTSDLTALGSGGGADGTVSLTAGGNIVNAGAAMAQVATGDLALSAATSIGTITDFAAGTGNAIDVAVSGKLTQATITEAGGTIFLNGDGDLHVAAGAINPDADGAATLLLKTTGALDLGTDAAALTLTAGDNVGLEAGTTLTLPDSGFDLGDGALRLVGGTDILDTGGRELGPFVASDLNFVSGAAGGLTTLQTSVQTLLADLSTAPAGTGLVVNESDAISLTQITTNGGDVTVNAGLSGPGDLTVLSVVARGAQVVLDTSTTGGRIVDGSDAEIDIVADSVALRAVDGIADGDQLEIDTATLAATTQRGDINISVVDPTRGLVIGTVDGTAGLNITAGNANDHIAVNGLGEVTVDAAVRNVGGGDVTLAARGTMSDANLTINAVVSTVGAGGHVSLFAGDTISISGSGSAQTSGTGVLAVRASTHIDDAGMMQNGVSSGAILMQNGARFGAEDGDILLQA
ncbi:MAG: beta strand repeat-containing protein, partial [Maioricimonas sp. JB049]